MPMPRQSQRPPGRQRDMEPVPDCGEDSYRGHDRLRGKTALITGGDSGIGRAVAIAFAREGADVAIEYLCEDDDAQDTARLVREAGAECELIRGDLSDPQHCREAVAHTTNAFGTLDVLVSNAAHQREYARLEDVSDDDWDRTWAVNVSAMFHLVKAALPHLHAGASIIASSSINADSPSEGLLAYAPTKAAVANFCATLAKNLGPRGIRVNSVAPGPIWTPLIPATLSPDHVERFGDNTPLGRAGQPAELAPAYVLLASDEGSYISGAQIAVTGGRVIL